MEFLKNHPLFLDIQPHILTRFWEYHSENPKVLALFLKFSRQVKEAGFEKYSIRAIQERLRWHVTFETKDSLFKLNDHYHACYARLLMILYPDEFGSFFETRTPKKTKEIYKEMNYHGENQ